MMRRSSLGALTVVLAALGAALPAYAHEVVTGCEPEGSRDSTSAFLSSIQGLFAGAGTFSMQDTRGVGPRDFMQGEESTNWNIKDQKFTKTSDWPAQDKAKVEGLLGKMPKCLLKNSNVQQIYRAEIGKKSSQLGFYGAVYSLQNQEYKGGRIILSDLFFDGKAYGGNFTGEQQMQIALGLEECLPADPRTLAPAPELRSMTLERVLFHELTHGLVHAMEDENRDQPWSIAKFPSRYEALLEKHYQRGSPLDTLNAKVAELKVLPPTPENRAAYCGAVRARNTYLRGLSAKDRLPQRWPGDLHAMESKDEYITILLDTVKYDPTGGGYSPEELAWARSFLEHTAGNNCDDRVAQGNGPNKGNISAMGVGGAPGAISDVEQHTSTPHVCNHQVQGWFQ